ncbi:MAG: aminoacyl-tRNA hydrolase, partial [Lachnospiraceae bacterium]|nr:aminoacyl-tRNA hydrolase [Lachnospiraceae bacterium]
VINGQKVILAKPLTFMNLSGESIRQLTDYYKVDPETELIVISDDISLPPGLIRVRKKGSAGGHNGLKNIIQHLGTEGFRRIRVGVGEKPEGYDLADYVLGHFSKEEQPFMKEGVEKAIGATEMILAGDIDRAMNEYNKKVSEK